MFTIRPTGVEGILGSVIRRTEALTTDDYPARKGPSTEVGHPRRRVFNVRGPCSPATSSWFPRRKGR